MTNVQSSASVCDFVAVTKPITNIIFDVDGVLNDQAPRNRLTWEDIFREVGLPEKWWPLDSYWQECMFSKVADTRQWLISKMKELRGIDLDEEEIRSLWHQRMKHHDTMLGLSVDTQMLHKLRSALPEHGKMIIITDRNSHRTWQQLGNLRQFFVNVITPDNSGCAPKPDPGMYDYAAERLGLEPSETVVLEDAPQGYKAATEAGFPCFVTGGGWPGDAKFYSQCRYFFNERFGFPLMRIAKCLSLLPDADTSILAFRHNVAYLLEDGIDYPQNAYRQGDILSRERLDESNPIFGTARVIADLLEAKGYHPGLKIYREPSSPDDFHPIVALEVVPPRD